MRVNDDYDTWNVAAQAEDPDSVLSFWKKALALRKQFDVFVCTHVCLSASALTRSSAAARW